VKRSRNLWVSVLFVFALAAGSLVAYITGIRPLLGLDLEGGVSVTLSAPEGTPAPVMNRTLASIRNRVDAFGVGEPDIFVTGNDIEVQIPGLADGTIEERAVEKFCLLSGDRNLGCYADEPQAEAAVDAIEVRERPKQVCLLDPDGNTLDCFDSQKAAGQAIDAIEVKKQGDLFCLVAVDGTNVGCSQTREDAERTKKGITTETSQLFCIVGEGGRSLGCFANREQTDGVVANVTTEPVDRKFCVVSSAGESLGCFLTRERAQARLEETGQERLIRLIGTTARLEQRQVLQTIPPGTPEYEQLDVTCATPEQRAAPSCAFDQLEDREVVFLGQGNDRSKYRLGPVELTGDAVRRATAVFNTATQNSSTPAGWLVNFELTPEGASIFGDVTTRLKDQQLAIVLDQQVISAPTINEAITGGSGQITGDFSEREARDLATTLNAGALPVELTQQQIVTVSPTLGEESLHQGLVAGLVGLAGLALYLFFYYRLLGVVAWIGMMIWAMLAVALVSLAGQALGYALSLAGIAGLVISLGVTADSYIVFFERLKDEVRNGKSPRAAVVPAFKRAYKTIVAADIVTGLAALGLYLTAVSSVRGFALTLGVATLLDLFVVYFFKRPVVFLIARSPTLVGLRGFGLRSGVAADVGRGREPAPVTGGSE
jgi:preprotein translocase subunit SecD